MNNAAQYQYGTQPPPPDLPYTGYDAVPVMGFGALLFFVGVCIASALRERRPRA
jgi:hypothetical protein